MKAAAFIWIRMGAGLLFIVVGCLIPMTMYGQDEAIDSTRKGSWGVGMCGGGVFSEQTGVTGNMNVEYYFGRWVFVAKGHYIRYDYAKLPSVDHRGFSGSLNGAGLLVGQYFLIRKASLQVLMGAFIGMGRVRKEFELQYPGTYFIRNSYYEKERITGMEVNVGMDYRLSGAFYLDTSLFGMIYNIDLNERSWVSHLGASVGVSYLLTPKKE